MIKLKTIVESNNIDVQTAINEFYDYSYLLKEGRQLNEFNIKDASKKASDLISFAVKKTGDAVNDAALKIYVAATSKLQASMAKIKANEKDKKRGLMLTIVNKIISFFVKNPKLAFVSARVGLTVLSLIGSAIAGYAESNNPDAFNDIFEKLGVDVDFSSVGDTDGSEDVGEMQELGELDKMDGEQLANKLNQDVVKMGLDVNKPDDELFLNKDNMGRELAPTDLMNDPAYADFQAAVEKIRALPDGEDKVRRLINLAKLDRVLDETRGSKGFNAKMDAKVYLNADIATITDALGTDGEAVGVAKLDSSNNLVVSNFELKYNGVTVSSAKSVLYSVSEKDGGSFTITTKQVSGVQFDIIKRTSQLTSGVDDDTVDQIFKGMRKFSDFGKTGSEWRGRSVVNESYQRMMVLAGIINEEGMLPTGVATVKKFVTNAKNAAQNFLTGLTKKLTQFSSSIGAIFASSENMNKLKDGREHKFVVKNGKIEII